MANVHFTDRQWAFIQPFLSPTARTGQTVPNQLKHPTDRPTMRWMFQCFESMSLVRFVPPHGPPLQEITGVEPLHEQVIRLLGPSYERLYELHS